MSSVQLTPVPQRIAILDEFVAGQTEVLAIEKQLELLTAEVRLNGDLIFQVRTHDTIEIRSNRVVSDSSGKDLFDLSGPSLRWSYAATSPDGKKTFVEVEFQGGCLFLASKARATFTSTTGTKHVLEAKIKRSDIKVDILDKSTRAVVARADRQLLDGGVGEVIVAPGVDKVLIGLMCICVYDLNTWK